jgi:hypothetical protein
VHNSDPLINNEIKHTAHAWSILSSCVSPPAEATFRVPIVSYTAAECTAQEFRVAWLQEIALRVVYYQHSQEEKK